MSIQQNSIWLNLHDIFMYILTWCCHLLLCCGLCVHAHLELLSSICPLPFSVPSVSNYNFDKSKQCIGAMTIEIDFLQKKSTDSSPYDSDKMAAEFIQQFNNQAFSVTQQVCTLRIRLPLFFALPLLFWSASCFSLLFFQLVFSFCDKLFGLMVKDIEAMDASILKGEPASGKKQKVLRQAKRKSRDSRSVDPKLNKHVVSLAKDQWIPNRNI